MKKILVVAAALALWASSALAAAPKTLSAGKYQAKIKALVCEGCKDNVEQTLKSFKTIEAVSVDQQKSTVSFSVKKGAKVSVAKLQQALKKSAGEMGMGADYTLQDLAKAR